MKEKGFCSNWEGGWRIDLSCLLITLPVKCNYSCSYGASKQSQLGIMLIKSVVTWKYTSLLILLMTVF